MKAGFHHLIVACSALAVFSGAFAPEAAARTVSGGEAAEAASRWIGRNPRPFAAKKLSNAETAGVDTALGEDGEPLFHLVKMAGGGVVAMSADTGIEPVVAFSGGGEVPADSPLRAILAIDMSSRLAGLRAARKAGGGAPEASGPEEAWTALLDAGRDAGRGSPSRPAKSALDSVPDVRVAPLVESAWGQGDAGGGPCFNYFTPSNYVCGCIATVGAQIMRYWRQPEGRVEPRTFRCWIEGVETRRSTIGGAFAWDDMPLVASQGISEAQRIATGHLCHDIGVAVSMDWNAEARGGSGSAGWRLPAAFRETFGYASAQCVTHENWGRDAALDDGAIRNAIWASLDAGCPVAIGIDSHEVIADGYGFAASGTAYTHLNMGWSGSCDVWYNLPLVDTGSGYGTSTILDEIVYNVSPFDSGDLLTGRVLDASGSPVAGAEVVATGGGSSYRTVSGRGGTYALWVAGDATYSVEAGAGGESATLAVFVPAAVTPGLEYLEAGYYGTSVLGNSWGNDIVLGAAPAVPDLSFDPDSPPFVTASASSGGDARTSFSTAESVYVVCPVANVGTAGVSAGFKVSATLRDSSGAKVSSALFSVAGLARAASAVPSPVRVATPLPAGTYSLEIAIDPAGDIPELDKADNSAAVRFAVTGSAASGRTLQNAVDNHSLSFTTGGSAGSSGWAWQSAETSDGVDAARSGATAAHGESWMLASGVSGPGVLTFRWRVSSRTRQDWVDLYVDGEWSYGWSGTGSGWRYEAFKLTDAGAHWFEWVYSREGSVPDGSNCAWVDRVEWFPESPLWPVYRFYSKNYKGHFFTMSYDEMIDLVNGNPNWNFEGIAYFARESPGGGTVPLHRFWSKRYRGHFYTTDEAEMQAVRDTNPNWSYEGIAYYVLPDASAGASPVHRFWSKGYRHHFYTMDGAEMENLRATNPNWAYEGTAFYAWSSPEAGAPETAAASSAAKEAPVVRTARATREDAPSRPSFTVSSAGIFPVGAWTLEVRLDAPDAAELAAGTVPCDSPAALPEIVVAVPDGTACAEVWSALRGGLSGIAPDSGTVAVEPAAVGEWLWVRASGGSGGGLLSLWMRLLP